MTLGIGDHVAKLHSDWIQNDEKKWERKFPETPKIVEGEMSREFEILDIQSGEDNTLKVLLKTVK